MADTLDYPTHADLIDQAQLCIVGGGVAGVAAALSSAAAGLETVLVEERGALGWEIPHGLELYLRAAESRPASLRKLLDALQAHGACRDGTLDPVATEVLLDRLVREAGVRVHFRCLAGEFSNEHVRLTTKSGPLAIKTCAVIDATDNARIARAAGAKFEPCNDRRLQRACLLCAVTPPQKPMTLSLEQGAEALLRATLWPNEAHLQITCTPRNAERSESESRLMLASAIEMLRQQPGFEKASLSMSAHEAFALRVPKLVKTSLPDNVQVAGSAVLGRHLTLEERAQLGEQAAAAAIGQLRGTVVSSGR